MKTKYTNKPNNVLPRAIGMDESVYNLSKRITEPYNPEEKKIETRLRRQFWGALFEQAYQNPYQTQRRYLEEYGYEHEERATWFPESKIMVSNSGRCPAYSGHHIGSTCGVCGQRD